MEQTEVHAVEEELDSIPEENSGEDTLESPPQAVEQVFSGFWRRILAFGIDMLILCVFGFVIGASFFNTLANMGYQGFWVGLIIAVSYFGWMNSSYKNGQTLGKRIMKIRVVDVLGNTIPLGLSLTRSAILMTPLMYTSAAKGSPALLMKAIMIFIMVAIIYLYIFNNKTRQTVHDLIVKTFVINAEYDLALAPKPIGTEQYLTMTAIGIIIVLVSLFAKPAFIEQYGVLGTKQTLNELQKDPNIYDAKIYHGVSNTPEGRSDRIDIIISVKKLPAPIYQKAAQISQLALDKVPAARDVDLLSVTVNHGYNIGIAWYRRSFTYAGKPDDWKTNTVKVARSSQKSISAGIGNVN